jgi:hypothetical protein
VHVCMCACVHVYMCACVHVCMCTCVYEYHISLYILSLTLLHARTHTHTRTHTQTHTHTHTHTHSDAEDDPDCAIAGMPVMRVWQSGRVVALKRGMDSTGYAGIYVYKPSYIWHMTPIKPSLYTDTHLLNPLYTVGTTLY